MLGLGYGRKYALCSDPVLMRTFPLLEAGLNMAKTAQVFVTWMAQTCKKSFSLTTHFTFQKSPALYLWYLIVFNWFV